MKALLLAGMLLVTPAYANGVELPDAMMGNWISGGEEGIMERASPNDGDFLVEKDKYYEADTVCTIVHIEKLSEYDYIVQSECREDTGIPAVQDTSEFELKGNRLRVTPATGS